MGTRTETLKFKADIEGTEKAKELGKAFDQLGDAAKAADPKAQELLDELARLNAAEKAISGLAGLRAQLQETGDKLYLAKQRTAELEAEFSATLEPTAKLTKALDRARGEVSRLTAEQGRQTAAVARAENTIQAAGYSLTQLARAQADVRDKTAQAVVQAREYAATLASTGKQAKTTGGLLQSLRNAVAGVFAALTARGAAEAVKDVALLGDAAEKTRNQFAQLYGSQAAGEAVLARLAQFADLNGLALDKTQSAAAKLKNFGIDPLNGSLQSLVDQNSAAGGSQEDLEGKILAVGQAWAKQKLQQEEILQLVERGVPVWELLAKATGKTVAELQKLSEAGKLGRAEISGLLAEIGKANSGAAAKNANTLSGLFQQLTGRVRQFFTEVSNSGPLEFFKAQLRGAIETIDRLARGNELESWARKTGAAIVAVSDAVIGAGKFIVEHIGTLVMLAKAYAAVKIGTFITDLAGVAAGAATAGKGITSLAAAFRLLPGNLKIAVALVGIELAIRGATELGEIIGRNHPETKKWEERTKELNAETAVMAERFRAATATLQQYADVQTKSAAQVAVLTEQERTRYAEGVAGLERYLKAQIAYYNALNQVGQLNDEGQAHLLSLRARLAEVESAVKVLNTTAAAAADTFRSKLSESVRVLAKQLEGAGASTKGIAEQLGKAFASIETDTVTKVGDIGLALAAVARESDNAARAVSGGLAVALRQLTGEELLKFQASAVGAFQAVGLSATDTAAILDTTLLIAMEKLGVAPEKFGLGMTAAGKQAVAAFQAITENARATGDQIEAAFTAATRAASSQADLDALGAALRAAADQGRIGFQAAERAALALQNRIREISLVTDPLADQFARLGIQSQRALDAARDAARDAYQAIADGARRGQATQEDVTRAFEAYAAQARAAAAQSTQAVRDQVEAHLRAEAAAKGVTSALVALGDAGADAGDRTAAAADKAATSLAGMGAAAGAAAGNAQTLGQGGNAAAAGLNNAATAAQAATESALGVSAAFADAAQSILGLDRVAFNVAAEQQARFDAELEQTRKRRAQYDETAQAVEALRREYGALNDAQLQLLATEQIALEREEQRRRDEQQGRELQSTANGSGAASASVTRVEVEISSKDLSGITLEKLKSHAFAKDVARMIIPGINELVRLGVRLRASHSVGGSQLRGHGGRQF